METQTSKNGMIDSLATELLTSASLKQDDIEQIVSDRELFSSVRARVMADSITSYHSSGTFTFFQRTMILSAAAAVIVIAVFGAMMFAKRPANPTIVRSVPAPQNDQRFISTTKPPQVDLQSGNIDGPPPSEKMPHIERAMEYRPVTSERRVPTIRQQPEIEQQQRPEFYALAGLRPSEVASDGSRIIRVELPRASLVALGVNVPLDSDKQLIKTDLLVGPDGMPRAIRLVE
jgi:hypothetical protein